MLTARGDLSSPRPPFKHLYINALIPTSRQGMNTPLGKSGWTEMVFSTTLWVVFFYPQDVSGFHQHQPSSLLAYGDLFLNCRFIVLSHLPWSTAFCSLFFFLRDHKTCLNSVWWPRLRRFVACCARLFGFSEVSCFAVLQRANAQSVHTHGTPPRCLTLHQSPAAQ